MPGGNVVHDVYMYDVMSMFMYYMYMCLNYSKHTHELARVGTTWNTGCMHFLLCCKVPLPGLSYMYNYYY